MRITILLAAAASIAFACPAVASDKTDAMMPIHQFIDNLDKGDMQAAGAAYAPTSSILDEFPPHAWAGATSFADWGRDFGTFSQKQGDTEPFVKLGKPKHIDVTDDRAYVVIPATFSFKEHGKKIVEKGSYMTFALQKLTDGWKITAWSWTRL